MKPEKTEYFSLPPQAVDVEKIVLGALLLEGDSFYRIAGIINENSFYEPKNAIVYKAIKSLNKAGKPIDLATVTRELSVMKELDNVGGPFYVTELTSRVASSGHIEHHARIIAEAYIRRELIKIARQTVSNGFDESIDLNELLNGFKTSVSEIENIAVSTHSGKIQSSTIKQALSEIEQDCININNGKTPGIPTGFKTVDKYTGGWRKTNLIILAARPGVGKTSLVLHFAKMAAMAGKWVNFYSMEMTGADLMRIMIAGESGVDRSNIRDGRLQEWEWNGINRSVAKLEKLPILWYDNAGMTSTQIEANTRKNVKKGQCDLVIIDYLQLMTPTDKRAIREQQISEMTRTLKRTALDSKVPVICLSQLNREASETKPQLHHLRESGAIEQDADIVLMPWIDPESEYNLIVAKNRRGVRGIIRLSAAPDFTAFYDADFHPPVSTAKECSGFSVESEVPF